MDIRDEKRKQIIYEFISSREYTKLTIKQLAVIFEVPKEDMKYLEKIISMLEKEGKIYIDDSKRICQNQDGKICVGEYMTKTAKFGFVQVAGEDIYIRAEESKGAISKDTVQVLITAPKTKLKNAEGRVIKILARGDNKIVGVFKNNNNFGFVIPINSGVSDIYIPKKYAANIPNDSYVVVKIEKYATKEHKAEGKIVEVIGSINSYFSDRDAIIKSHGVVEAFDEAVLTEARSAATSFNIDEELNCRVDLRDKNIYTIDGDDAKDLDDAVCVEDNLDGTYTLYVSIADVSYYVKEGSALDKEAFMRGTSIYMPSHVIPMLPKELSNGVCSLNKGEDKLTLTVQTIINEAGQVLYSTIYKSIISSKCRMTYSKVQDVLDGKEVAEYIDFVKDIKNMETLAKILNNKREKNGSINFDIPETKISIDDKGNVQKINPYVTTFANQIIEEFMLVANEVVAKTFYELSAPFIYRIHPKPELETLRELNEVLGVLNIDKIKGINKVHPKALDTIIEKYKTTDKSKVVSKLVLRALKLATYSDECQGHFALNFKYYSHFTSPIRRYPDLFIHRVISKYIENGYTMPEEELNKLYKMAKKAAINSTQREKVATMLERDVNSMYMAKYMRNHLGEEFEGIISSVTNFGIFVELENTVEGLIPLVSMYDDYYVLDLTGTSLVGEMTRTKYSIGDKINVKVARADTFSHKIDFEILWRDEYETEFKGKTKSKCKNNRKAK